jgi:hypothetical protein
MQPQTVPVSIPVAIGTTTSKLNIPGASTNLCTIHSQTCTTIGCSTTTTNAATALPGPPESVAVRVYDENTLQVTIEPPLNDGGANITHYTVEVAQYCLKIITGTDTYDKGTLEVYVHDGSSWNTEASKNLTQNLFELNEIVLEKCYSSPFSGLEVKNPNTQGWGGQILVGNQHGDYVPMVCLSCNGTSTSTESIDFDGDSSLSNRNTATCLNGNRCAITLPSSMKNTVKADLIFGCFGTTGNKFPTCEGPDNGGIGEQSLDCNYDDTSGTSSGDQITRMSLDQHSIPFGNHSFSGCATTSRHGFQTWDASNSHLLEDY